MAVMQCGHWKTLGKAWQGTPLAIRADQDVLSRVIDVNKMLQLVSIIICIHVEVQARRIYSAVGIITIHAQWQSIIPIPFVSKSGSPPTDHPTTRFQRQGKAIILALFKRDRTIEAHGISCTSTVSSLGKVCWEA